MTETFKIFFMPCSVDMKSFDHVGMYYSIKNYSSNCSLSEPLNITLYPHIEINLCLPNPCKNGATCTERVGGRYECTCPIGYKGITCEGMTYS